MTGTSRKGEAVVVNKRSPLLTTKEKVALARGCGWPRPRFRSLVKDLRKKYEMNETISAPSALGLVVFIGVSLPGDRRELDDCIRCRMWLRRAAGGQLAALSRRR